MMGGGELLIDSEIKYEVLKNFNKLFVENVHTIRDSDSPLVVPFAETANDCKFTPEPSDSTTNTPQYQEGKIITTPYPNLKVTQDTPNNNKTIFEIVDRDVANRPKPLTIYQMMSNTFFNFNYPSAEVIGNTGYSRSYYRFYNLIKNDKENPPLDGLNTAVYYHEDGLLAFMYRALRRNEYNGRLHEIFNLKYGLYKQNVWYYNQEDYDNNKSQTGGASGFVMFNLKYNYNVIVPDNLKSFNFETVNIDDIIDM